MPVLIMLIIALCAAIPVHAADISLFPEHPKPISAETMPYTQMLHSGVENDTFYVRGRFGVDFPVVGYNWGGINNGNNNGDNHQQTIMFGINAAAHINMRPTSGMVFPVDNFYAVLAVCFSGTHGPAFSWRFYPVYHVSAHLADGYPGDVLKADVRAVSSEMVSGEAYYKLFGGILEIGAGAGWYYHVCAQKDLSYRAGISILITPPGLINQTLQPFVLTQIENVRQTKNNPGIDASAGVFLLGINKEGAGAKTNPQRALGLSLRYFNRLHSGYYFERYEVGWGAEILFLL